ncbi:MAG TPA: cytochrome b [Acetobacteraceae bacterium]|jgi:cytochrome b561|nr:cytochrome b [Acetobacteraceae bacterium]
MDSLVVEPATQGLRHDTTTISLHWITAALVALLWIIGQTVDFPPTPALRTDYRSLHIVLGVALGIVLLVRLAWRLTRRNILPAIDHGLILIIARLTHWGLYALMLLTVGLGIATTWSRGDSVFGLFTIPAFDPGNRALMREIHGWHALAANIVLIVAGLHAAAALFHHFIMRDLTLRRMLPWQMH